MEEEFQDWYDTEHFPERATLKGFLTARRFICVDGWPRYLTLYDLQDVSVLHGPDYAKFAGEKYSPWTHRVVSPLMGPISCRGCAGLPGQALLGDRGAATRLLLCRFRQVRATWPSRSNTACGEVFEARPDAAQVRLFVPAQPDGTDYLGIVELMGRLL